jgi:hypothetical protein
LRVNELLKKKSSLNKIQITLAEEKIKPELVDKALVDIVKKSQEDIVEKLKKSDQFIPDMTFEARQKMQKTLSTPPPKSKGGKGAPGKGGPIKGIPVKGKKK